MRKPEVLRPADYLILEALSRRPMSTGEVSRATGCSTAKVAERLKKFETNNLVIRGKANKWYAAMVVWVAPVVDVAEGISGEKVLFKTPGLPELHEPAEEPAEEPKPALPDLAPPKPEPEAYKPPAAPRGVKVSDRARTISDKLHVPDYLAGRGEVSMGRVAKCELCPKTTPLRYGADVVCPMCARGGR